MFGRLSGGDGCSGYRHTDSVKQEMKLRNTGRNNPSARSVTCDGKVFETMRACAVYYGIREKTMQKWLSG